MDDVSVPLRVEPVLLRVVPEEVILSVVEVTTLVVFSDLDVAVRLVPLVVVSVTVLVSMSGVRTSQLHGVWYSAGSSRRTCPGVHSCRQAAQWASLA
jgi:hypothetical protein